MQLTPWGSFEAWSELVRQAIVWCGLPDPATTRTELTSQSDREASLLRQLIAGWEELDPNGTGLTVGAVLESLGEHQHSYETLRAALWELTPPKDGKSLNPRSIGMKLHYLRRRVIGGKFLDSRDERGTAAWFVAGDDHFGNCGTRGTSGTTLAPCARADTHTHESPEGAGISPASPSSPAPADCFHDWQDTRNGDGIVKRTCRLCGEFYGHMQEAQQ